MVAATRRVEAVLEDRSVLAVGSPYRVPLASCASRATGPRPKPWRTLAKSCYGVGVLGNWMGKWNGGWRLNNCTT